MDNYLYKIPEKYRECVEFIEPLNGCYTKVKYKNLICGCYTYTNISSLIRRKQFDYCRECNLSMGVWGSLNLEHFLKKIPEEYVKNVEIVGDFLGQKTKINYINSGCGCVSKTDLSSLTKRNQFEFCKTCYSGANIHNKIKSLEYFLKKIPEEYVKNVEIVGDFIGQHTNIIYKNPGCGCSSKSTLCKLPLKRSFEFCSSCYVKKIHVNDLNYYLSKIPEKYLKNIEIIGDFTGRKTRVLYKNPGCSCVVNIGLNSLISRKQFDFCKSCYQKNDKKSKNENLKDYIYKIKKEYGESILSIGDDCGDNTIVDIKYNVCKCIYKFKIKDIIRNKKQFDICSYCKRKQKNNDKLKKYLSKIPKEYIENLKLLEEYKGCYTKAEYSCPNCGDKFASTLASILQRKRYDVCRKCISPTNLTKDEMLKTLYGSVNNPKIISGYPGNRSTIISANCLKCNNLIEDTYFNISQYYKRNSNQCKKCAPNSAVQNSLYDFVKSLDLYAVINDRKTISKELDIYCPKNKFAIEYNGLYYHSELYKDDKNYHWNKTKECRDIGVTLLHIWEDRFLLRPEVYKSIIKYNLGMISNKTHARLTKIKELTKDQIKLFFNENHIDGNVGCITAWGLFKDDKLLQAISVRKVNKQNKKYANYLEIARSATLIDNVVVGGESKLLNHVEKFAKEHGFVGILNYVSADFGGFVKNKWKFKYNGETSVSYFYIKRNDIYRVSRHKLQAKSGISERELAKMKDMLKVYSNVNLIYTYEFLD